MWSDCPCFEGTGKSIEDIDAELLAEAEDTGAEAKALGTLQHAALASIYMPDAAARAAAFALITEKQADDVRWVATKINEIAEGLGYQQHELRVEQRVTMFKGESFEILYFGTADVEAGPTIIFDAKFGLVRDYFAQLVGYLLPKLIASGHRVGRAYTVYGRSRRVQSYVIDMDTAEAVAYGILAKRADPHRRPRACQFCGWCANKAGCEAITVQVAEIVERREDWPLKLPRLHSSEMLNDPAVLGAALFVWKSFIEPWGGGVEFVAKGMMERGMMPTGFNKQNGRGKGTFTSVRAALNVMREAGVPDEILDQAITLSVTGLAKAYGKAHKLGDTAASTRVKKLLSGAGIYAEGEAYFKMVRDKNAESMIRCALGNSVAPVLTQGASLPNSHNVEGKSDV
jgi:hypothetical protein